MQFCNVIFLAILILKLEQFLPCGFSISHLNKILANGESACTPHTLLTCYMYYLQYIYTRTHLHPPNHTAVILKTIETQ